MIKHLISSKVHIETEYIPVANKVFLRKHFIEVVRSSQGVVLYNQTITKPTELQHITHKPTHRRIPAKLTKTDGTTCMTHEISTASAVQGVGVEDGEDDEQDGGDEAEGGGGADVAAELVVDVADLVPPRVLVPLQPHPRHGPRCAGRRRHDRRVNLQVMYKVISGFSP